MNLDSLDLEALTKDVSGALADGLADLLEGSSGDFQEFVTAISRDLLTASLTQDEALTGQLLDQLKVVAELQRLRASSQGWQVVQSVTRAIFKAVTAGVLAAFL